MSEAVLSFEQSNGSLISSTFVNQFVGLLDITTVADRTPNKPHELQLGLTNYQTYTSDILLAIADNLLADVPALSLPASSSLIFEVGNDGNIRAFLNDVEYALKNCTIGEACTVDSVISLIKSSNTTDATTACQVDTNNHLIQ